MIVRNLTRYEIFENGQSLQVGFMQGLSEIGAPYEEEKFLLEAFNRELTEPDYDNFENPHAVSCFTEEGIQHFEKPIQMSISYINEYLDGLYDVRKSVYEVAPNSEDIVYADKFQVVVNLV